MASTLCQHYSALCQSNWSTMRLLESSENIREKILSKLVALRIGHFFVNESFGELPASSRLHTKRVPALTGIEELKEGLPGAHQEAHRRGKHIPLLLRLARGQADRRQLSGSHGRSTTQPSQWEYEVHLIPGCAILYMHLKGESWTWWFLPVIPARGRLR